MGILQKPKLVITRTVPSSVAEIISESFSAEFNLTDKPFSNAKLSRAFETADGVLCTVSDQITADIIGSTKKRTSIISNYGVGVSNINIEHCKKLGLVVTNTPDVLTEATAEIALFLILAVSRRASYLEAKLRQNLWKGFSIVEDLGFGLRGKTLGIIGMGRIGQATALKVSSSLGMKIIFFNRSPVKSLNFSAQQAKSLDDLLINSDVVSLHAPGGGVEPILMKKHFHLMKKSAFLINTARGDIVDQEAMITALKNNEIAGVGLDVYLKEPHVPEELLSMQNATLLPHIGSATIETREAMGMLAVENLKAHFFNQKYPSRVI